MSFIGIEPKDESGILASDTLADKEAPPESINSVEEMQSA
jgi:hypothetical protein